MERINVTPNDGYEYFFGYYDLQPFDKTNSMHLAHRVKFRDRLPLKTDIADIGYINIAEKKFYKIAETCAWNFQQGALLSWFEDGKSVLFNDFDGEKFISRVVGIDGKEIRRYSMPLGAVSKDRKKGLSINFARIFDFRPGYGYSNIKDEYFSDNAPKTDGIFEVDLISGSSRLVSSYFDMKKIFFEPPFTDSKLVVNHITFNRSGTEFVILLRNFPETGKKWGTVLAVGDLNGNFRQMTKFQVNSHYSFKDDKTLAIWSGLPEYGVYFFDLISGEKKRLRNPITDKGDIHVNFAPDGKSFIGDGYVEEGGVRSVYRYEMESDRMEKLFSVYSEPAKNTDVRCDLHARFSIDGKLLSYDTTENSRREIYVCK